MPVESTIIYTSDNILKSIKFSLFLHFQGVFDADYLSTPVLAMPGILLLLVDEDRALQEGGRKTERIIWTRLSRMSSSRRSQCRHLAEVEFLLVALEKVIRLTEDGEDLAPMNC